MRRPAMHDSGFSVYPWGLRQHQVCCSFDSGLLEITGALNCELRSSASRLKISQCKNLSVPSWISVKSFMTTNKSFLHGLSWWLCHELAPISQIRNGESKKHGRQDTEVHCRCVTYPSPHCWRTIISISNIKFLVWFNRPATSKNDQVIPWWSLPALLTYV